MFSPLFFLNYVYQHSEAARRLRAHFTGASMTGLCFSSLMFTNLSCWRSNQQPSGHETGTPPPELRQSVRECLANSGFPEPSGRLRALFGCRFPDSINPFLFDPTFDSFHPFIVVIYGIKMVIQKSCGSYSGSLHPDFRSVGGIKNPGR